MMSMLFGCVCLKSVLSSCIVFVFVRKFIVVKIVWCYWCVSISVRIVSRGILRIVI